MHLLLLKKMSRREGSDTEHSRRNQCVSSKIYYNFNETPASYRTIPMNYGEIYIYIYTYISILRKPITLRWRTTVKDDSIHSPDCSRLFPFFFLSFFTAARRIELPHYVNFPGDACIFLIPFVSFVARCCSTFSVPFRHAMRQRENPRERFLYRDVGVENETIYGGSKTRQEARVAARGNVRTNRRRGFRKQRCAPEEIEKESERATAKSENERHEAP